MRIPSTPIPPCGWNSYDSCGIYLTEADALAHSEAFVAKLKPHGYEYFCSDACWYAEGDFRVDKSNLINDDDLALVTDPEMLACNRNGDIGKRILWERHVDVRRCVDRQNPAHGWLGLFNRQSMVGLQLVLTPEELGFAGGFPETLYSIWDEQMLTPKAGRLELNIEGSGVVFIRYASVGT